MTIKASTVQCSDNGWNDYTVDVLMEDDEVISWGSYDNRGKAEAEARKAAKAYSCSWETNY